jgi:hypothetical protein
MRYRNYGRKSQQKKPLKIIFIGLLVLFSLYFGSVVFIINDVLRETTHGEINTDNFIAPDFDLMAQLASELEAEIERVHLPLDYPLSIKWKDSNYTDIDIYGDSGDAAALTGVLLGAEAYRYAVAKKEGNLTEMATALVMVRRILTGASLLLAIPNGGIGPQFGGILARSVWSPNYQGPPIQYYNDFDFAEKDVFNGTGVYSNWRYIGYPSTDQNCNFMFGLSRVAIFVSKDDTFVQNLTSLLTQQIIENLIRTNWQLIDAGGRTTGQTFDVGIENSAYWVLGSIKMAILANPTMERYQKLYYHYTYELDYLQLLNPTYPLAVNNVLNYYSQNLQFMIFFTLLAEESDPYLRKQYIQVLESKIYAPNRLGRNAFFNVAYLAMIRQNHTQIALDIADQLMRYSLNCPPNNSTHIPVRGNDRNPIPDDHFGRNRTSYWHNFFVNNSMGKLLYSWLTPMLIQPENITLNTPRTVDQSPPQDNIWTRNPWELEPYVGDYTLIQHIGLDYLIVYYMGRYYNIWDEDVNQTI